MPFPDKPDILSAGQPIVRNRLAISRSRVALAMTGFLVMYACVAGRLAYLAITSAQPASSSYANTVAAARPDILDRNGELLATDIRAPSLFAQPRKIVDADEASELLAGVFPDFNTSETRLRLSTSRGFVWLRRQLTGAERDSVHALGIPGLGFINEHQRIYPAGRTTSHLLGHVNVDNEGIAGLERWVDRDRGLTALHEAGFAGDRNQSPVRTSVDLRVQHVMRSALAEAMARYRAIAASGSMMNVRTGEIVAMVSLPDYDPSHPSEALQPDRINRVTTGTYELGSVFKAFTIAMGIDSGRYTMASVFDARAPLTFGGMRIRDPHGQARPLSLLEVFLHSSNIGTARLALAMGIEHHRKFLERFGMLTRLRTELPESAAPIYPRNWRPVNSATIGFGHGITAAPLQALAGAAALINGGYLIQPTFQMRTEEQVNATRRQVMSKYASDVMRYLFRINVLRGGARRAEVDGLRVGGKTGTAEKVVEGRYVRTRNMTSFLAAFPMDRPEFILLVSLDEPKGVPETNGGRTAAFNAAPTAAKIIEHSALFLGVYPRPGGETPVGPVASEGAAVLEARLR